jgi:hypothetical protein
MEAFGQKLVIDGHLLVVSSARRTAFVTEGGADMSLDRDYAQLALDAGRAFSPVAPIDERALLAGRTAQ